MRAPDYADVAAEFLAVLGDRACEIGIILRRPEAVLKADPSPWSRFDVPPTGELRITSSRPRMTTCYRISRHPRQLSTEGLRTIQSMPDGLVERCTRRSANFVA